MTDSYSTPSTDPGPDKKEAKRPDGRLRKYWREIEQYNKAATDWNEQAEKIVKLYLDQHRTAASPRRFALLWSNTETLKPVVYGKLPTVLVSRRYKDQHPVGRIACEILERATNCTFDLYNADETFRMVRDDRLLVARGQAWVRYEASFDTVTPDGEAPDADEADADEADSADQSYERLAGEKVCIDYVHWSDFGHNVAGTWKDVWLIWRRVYKTRDEATERFSAELADKLSYSARLDSDGKLEAGEHTAAIYEIWDKRRGQVVWISKECPEFLDEGKPPLNFHDFFPCPEPCYGSKVSKSLIPTPDYRYYQDQAQEIDDLTEKIANLTDWLMLKAFIPAGPSADGADAVRMMIESMQATMTTNKNLFVPVESWAGFAERGGSKQIDWLPINLVTEALKGAIETRALLVQDVYQITGISDILRGQTDPNETLGAQELKAQTGSRRVRNAKDEIARFTRDMAKLVAEVIAEQFQPETLAEMTGLAYQPAPPLQPGMPQAGMSQAPGMMPPPPPAMRPGLPAAPALPPQGGIPTPQPGMAPTPGMPPQAPPQPEPPSAAGMTFDDQVVELLRNDRMRGFLIDIETDSTIQPDEDAEKQRRTEFVQAVGGFLKEAREVVAAAPSLTPMVKEMLMFTVRGFRAGRSLEETIERSMDQLQQELTQAGQRPDPEMVKAEALAKAKEAETAQTVQLEQTKSAALLQAKQQESAAAIQLKREETAAELELERQKAVAQAQLEQQKQAAADAAEQRKIDAEIARKDRAHAQDMAHKHDMYAVEQRLADEAHLAGMGRDAETHSAKVQREAQVSADKEAADKAQAETPTKPKRVKFMRGRDGKIAEAEIG